MDPEPEMLNLPEVQKIVDDIVARLVVDRIFNIVLGKSDEWPEVVLEDILDAEVIGEE